MTEWPIFDKLITNVKSHTTVEIPLGPCTAFVSPNNQAMKTALGSDAPRLAFTGKHPIGPHPTNLAGLMDEHNEQLTSVLENGKSTCRFAMTMVNGKAKKPTHQIEGPLSQVDPSSLIPTFAYRELITFGSAKMREAVFSRFGGRVSKLPAPRGLTDEQEQIWEHAASQQRGGPAERLSALVSHFRKEKLRLGREAKSLDQQPTDLDESLPGDPSGAELLPSLRAELAEAYRREGQQRSSVSQAQLDEAEMNFKRTEAEGQTLAAELQESANRIKEIEDRDLPNTIKALDYAKKTIQAHVDKQPRDVSSLPGKGLITALERFIQAGADTCPCCLADNVDLKAIR